MVPNPTPIAQAGTIYRRPTHFHHMSSEVSRSFAWRPASEQMTIRNEGIVHCSLAHIHATSIRAPSSALDVKMRPRGGRFYRPPTAAPLSLKPDGHFQPLWWLKLAGPCGHWLGLDVPSTGTVCGGCHWRRNGEWGRMGSFGTVAKLPLCYKRYVLYHPWPAPPLYRTVAYDRSYSTGKAQ